MIILDFKAKYVSREASLFEPIWRASLTEEQAVEIIEDLVDILEEKGIKWEK